jgi:L-lactate dehydrogenase
MRDTVVMDAEMSTSTGERLPGQPMAKGFGLALMVEALTQGLSGFGRKDTEKRWGGNVFLQVLDPEAFAGREAFLGQMDYLAEQCRANAPLREGVPVRLPGELAESRIALAQAQGLVLAEPTLKRLGDCAGRYALRLPVAEA